MGHKRARALAGAHPALCCDPVLERAQVLAASTPGARVVADWREAAVAPDIDLAIVATTHDMLAPVAALAASAGKHVLIEKPGARRAAELDAVAEAASRTGALVRVGYNHRAHRALRKAHDMAASGAVGELMFVRGRYGHGGRPGYDREWRANSAFSGGGELIDQGVHLIDLARWFLGEFTCTRGSVPTFFWDMPVEDNAFLLLETERKQVAFLHASWTEWKNLFSVEIYGRTGKLEITGLGGSYGTERLAFYEMLPEMGPPPTQIWEYPMPDNSWETEFQDFLHDIRLGRQPSPGIADAQAVLRVVESVYQEAQR